MSYRLGIDLGTCSLGAASVALTEPTVLDLGNRSAVLPAAVFLAPGEDLTVGEQAVDRGTVEPTRLANDIPRRLGDPNPLVLGGQAVPVTDGVARLIRTAVDAAFRQQRELPDQVVVTHPSSWDPARIPALREALARSGVPGAQTCPAPVAAAVEFAATHDVADGDLVAVVDVGGGQIDAAIVRATPHGFELIATAGQIAAFGGVDIDQLVLRHVLSRLPPIDPTDADYARMMARLLRDCTAAKEVLSTQTQVGIQSPVPGSGMVSLTRPDLEAMISGPLDATLGATWAALRAGGGDISAVRHLALIGGGSQIPLVRSKVATQFSVALAGDVKIKLDVALGAARYSAMLPAAGPGAILPAMGAGAAGAGVAGAAGAVGGFGAAGGFGGSAAAAVPPPPPPTTAQMPPWLAGAGGAPLFGPGSTTAGTPSPYGTSTGQPPGTPGTPPVVTAPTGAGGAPAAGQPGGPVLVTAPVGAGGSGAGAAGGPGASAPGSGGPGQVSLPFVLADMPLGDGPAEGAAAAGAGAAKPPDKKKPKLGLIIGLVAGVVVLALGVVAAIVFVLPKLKGPGEPDASPTPTASGSGTQSPPPTNANLPTAATPLNDDQILVPRVVSGADSRIFLANIAGVTPPKKLASPNKGPYHGPSLSPDRRTIIYIDGALGTLRTMAADGTKDAVLLKTPPKGCGLIRHMSWSPTDLNRMVVECDPGDDAPDKLLVIDLKGKVIRELKTGRPRISDPTVSPDGRTVAYWASPETGPNGGAIYTIALDGSGKPKQLTKSAPGVDADPAWSPDGTRIAFRRRDAQNNMNVYLMKADGTGVQPLVTGPAVDEKPAWSPDGTRVLVISNRGPGGTPGKTFDLYLVPADGSAAPKPLGLTAESISTPTWSHR